MRFGIHVPHQGTLTATARYAAEIGCQAIQVFSGNPLGWEPGTLGNADRDGFVGVVREAGIAPVLVHAPYLVNLAAHERSLRSRSRCALALALKRASDLRAGPVVVHAGNHKGAGADTGIARAVETLAWVLERSPSGARIAVEGGSGKGTDIGITFDELARMVEPFPPGRVGVLLDTAHLWALGHDLRDEPVVRRLVRALKRGPGLERLCAIHVNDNPAELGSRRDLHAFWGQGRMGARALKNLVTVPEFADLAMIFEVPGETAEYDTKRLAAMRRLETKLRRGTRPVRRKGK
jgi:deoxyribonuclease-4